jgi:diguanylate cyclase (GGDEF)-like protein
MKNIQIILNAFLSKDIFEYILVDKEFKVDNSSSGLEKYLGTSPKVGDDVLDFLPELVGSEDEIRNIFDNQTLTYLLESVHKNNYYVNVSIEHYDENIVLVLLHNITDITLSQQKLLQYSNESILLNNTLQKILDSQNALLFVTYNNEISYTNEQFMDYFSVKEMGDLRRKNLQIYKYLDYALNDYDGLFERVNSKEEYVVINKDTFILQATWIESTHKLFTLTKVTKLTKEMQTDALTGAYKKSYFNIQLTKMIENKEEGILVVLDIDNFKNINDTFGHQAGDDVLVEFVTLIQDNIRGDDLLARWGGEEFLLLLKHTNVENAMKKIESLRSLIDAFNFKHIGHMTSSFGVALKEEDDDIHTFLQRADKALYEAKDRGKNCIVFKKA